jgi:hypothetical protein
MAFFHVLVHGENFLIDQGGSQSWMGFFKNIYVDAGTADEASSIAISRIAADPAFRASVKNPADKPPELSIEEANEIDPDPSLADSAFTFFPSQNA